MATPQEATFVERITAGATHELRNVLAIVKEAAGLIEDLLYAGAKPGTLDRDKVRWAVARIEAQVGRGTALVGALNRFAHSLGESAEPVALSVLVEHTALLGQRFVRRNELRLQVGQVVGGSTVVADPLRVFMALVAGIEECATKVPAGGVVILTAESWSGKPAVRFTGEDGAGIRFEVRADPAVMNRRLGQIGAMGEVGPAGEIGAPDVTSMTPAPLVVDEGSDGFLFVFPVGRVR